MKKCNLCGEVFKEFDEVVLVNERDYFHEACVALSPIKYAVFENSGDANYDDFLGTCDDEDIQLAEIVFDEGEYLKEGEEDD
ncbi:hypothetical protein H0279_002998 [Listeria monocytogenes]|uniref:hypothetical protein n=1 Tax=Listeria monocytogenes TaxID=1639 RepID=UPI0019A7CCB5|nr:hypothetical protein [Listeria monocytogenes]EFR8911453.1 hypothetical protein [Listeria monocytogenes]EFR8992786.1 hypothetical protein [Listeria monocytogenes]EFR8998754.1 hypothetical protein [Listeria monocytogenes]EGB0167365.1 hypothetical protein [Listeria monocytogenes]